MPRARKVCATPGCPALVPAGTSRCPQHARETDAARGRRQARGYGADHDQLRKQWAPVVAAGLVDCSRCGKRILPGQAWHLDHTDDRQGYRGPSHADCNLSAAGKAAHRIASS